MNTYMMKHSRDGRNMYYRNGRLTRPDKISDDIRNQIEKGDTVTANVCIFCPEATKLTRILNSQTVYLCNEHFYSKSIGQVAQQIRELDHDHEEKEEN